MPDAFVQISSIMPQKRNPVPIEHLRHLASQTMARAHAMLDVMHNTPFTDMNDSEGESQAMGYAAFVAAHRVLDLMTALLPALSINRDRVAENIRKGCATITELADSLVRIEGLSFRQVHEIASQVARNVFAGMLAGSGNERSLTFTLPGVAAAGIPERLRRSQTTSVLVGVRPQDLRLSEGDPAGLTVEGKVSVVEPLGAETYVHIDTGEETLVATTTGRSVPHVGAAVRATAHADMLCYFDSATEKAL